MKKQLFLTFSVVLILFLCLESKLNAQVYCGSPYQGTTRTYILSPTCTTTVDICYYCNATAPIITLGIMGTSDFCPGWDPNDYWALVREKVMNDWAILCGSTPCNQGTPATVNIMFPTCMQYFWNGTTLSCTSCTSVYCYYSYTVCWDYYPPPGHSRWTLVDPCHTEETSPCLGVAVPVIGIDTPPLTPNVAWSTPSTCFNVHCDCK